MLEEKTRGFTLIELLVAIAIIGILAAVVIVALGSARAKSRDTRRKVDINEVQRALDVYADDHDGFYPMTTPTSADNPLGFWRSSASRPNDWVPGLESDYIKDLPVDPINKENVSQPYPVYYYTSNGTDYKVIANKMESGVGKKWATEDGGKISRNCPENPPFSTCGYELFTFGAQNW